jgi:hypothetical protein
VRVQPINAKFVNFIGCPHGRSRLFDCFESAATYHCLIVSPYIKYVQSIKCLYSFLFLSRRHCLSVRIHHTRHASCCTHICINCVFFFALEASGMANSVARDLDAPKDSCLVLFTKDPLCRSLPRTETCQEGTGPYAKGSCILSLGEHTSTLHTSFSDSRIVLARRIRMHGRLMDKQPFLV